MKKTGVIIGIVLLFLLACGVIFFVHRSIRHIRAEVAMGRRYPVARFMERPQMYGMRRGRGNMMMGNMFARRGFNNGQGMGPGPMAGMRSGWGRGPMAGMRRGMGPAGKLGAGPLGPGGRILESIPNVTDAQKKEITDLRLKQQNDMKKLREDVLAKIKTLRESDKKEILNILNDDQKKFLESQPGFSKLPGK